MLNRTISCLFIILFVNFANAQTVAKRHALIIAIGDYPASSGWSKISSVQDVPRIENALLQHQFSKNNITSLMDSNATVNGIKMALDSLIIRVNRNDIVVIHVSSHGEQIEDNNGDESDGLDESIVAFNAIYPDRSKSYSLDSSGYFRDDDFGKYMKKLRQKLGPDGDLLVCLDACHSGSGTRGVQKVRGGKPPLVSASFNRNKYSALDTNGVFKEGTKWNTIDADLARFVVISAARAEELDAETVDENNQSIGSLTYAVSKVFANLDSGVSYRAFFAKIQNIMHSKVPGQHPVIEGNGIDNGLLGGHYIKQQKYIGIKSIGGVREIVLNAGILSGLSKSAKVVVCAAGTAFADSASILDSGEVIRADNYSALVKLNTLQIKDPTAFWVFITESVYKVEQVSIGFAKNNTADNLSNYSEPEIQALKDATAGLTSVNFEGLPDLILCKGKESDTLKMAGNGYVFEVLKKDNLTQDFAFSIERFSQYKFLQNIKIKDANMLVDVKLVPFKNGKIDTGMQWSKVNNGTLEVRVGDTFVLWVKNIGNKAVYVNILDIQPNGYINPILPNINQNLYSRDLLFKIGAEKYFSDFYITIAPPYGFEIFKIFVANQEIDMEHLATSRGVGTKGSFAPLELLVKKSYNATRGVNIVTTRNSDGTIIDLPFTILE